MKRVIVSATAVVALAIGTVAGLALSSTVNPKLVVSCEAKSCSVQLPGAALNEMNETMIRTMSQAAESEKASEQAFLKELNNKLFEQAPAQHDATTEDSDAEFVQEIKKFFQ